MDPPDAAGAESKAAVETQGSAASSPPPPPTRPRPPASSSSSSKSGDPSMGGAGLTLPPGAKEAAPIMKFTLPTNRTFVRYGDCVSLFDQVGSHGFLNADGVIDDSLRIIVNSDGSVPDKFRDCVFTIMPSQQYAAQKEFRKKVLQLQKAVAEEVEGVATNTAGAEEDEGYYMSLQESAERELEMNADHNAEKILADAVLKYGQVIQLMHNKTGKYVTANTKRVAVAEKDCQFAGLDDGGSAYSWFTILPRFKMRSLGDEVETSDCVIFELYKQEGTYLHCSERPAHHLVPFQAGISCLHEGSIGSLTGWILTLYRAADDGRDPDAAAKQAAMGDDAVDMSTKWRGTLQAGKLVRLFHTEARSYVGIRTKVLRMHAVRQKKNKDVITDANIVLIEKVRTARVVL